MTGFAETKDKPEEKVKPKTIEIGDSGTRIFDGVIREEYNTKLDGIKGIAVYDEMRKSDSTVRAILLAVKLPILSAQWRVKPASEDDQDQTIAQFVHDCLFEYQELKFLEFLRQALLSQDFGVMAFEKVFEVRALEGGDRVVWKKLAPRLPRSIQKWAIAGGKPGIVQNKNDGAPVDIPMDKLIVFVNEKEGDNWWGTSLLRAAYKPWYMKCTLEKIDAIAHERQGLGIPYAKLPENSTAADNTKAETLLKNMRANEHAFVLIPDGYEIGFMDMQASTTRDPSNSLAYHSREIMKSVLAQFLELGSTSAGGTGGSRALSENHSRLFLQAEETLAQWMCDVMRDPIKELVDLNFAGVKKYPELDFEGITQEDVSSLASTYASLKNSGAMTAQDADEDSFREKLGLPELEESGIREDEPEPTDPREAHEHPHQKKSFAEGFKPFRKLTFAEKKVDFEKLNSTMTALENDLDAQTKGLLHEARDKYMAALTRAAHKGDTAAIKEATLKVKAEYTRILKSAMKGAFEYGKTNAAKEIGRNAPSNPKYITDQIDIQSDAIADAHIADIIADSKNAYSNAINKGLSVTAALAAADVSAAEAIDILTRDAKSILTSAYINHGRDEIFDRYAPDVYALQRSELLDPTTCNYCLSIDGRIVEKDDIFARNGTFHSNCRGIWVAILQDEEDKPKIGGVPQSLRDRFGDAVNDLVQPKKPITKKNSAARNEADKRPE